MLNCYSDPVYRQMVMEVFSVLTKIMKRHPGICFVESLNVDQILEQTIKLYVEVCKKNKNKNKNAFFSKLIFCILVITLIFYRPINSPWNNAKKSFEGYGFLHFNVKGKDNQHQITS